MKAFHPRTSASGCSPSKPELRERPLLARGRSGELAGLFAVLANDTRLLLLHALARKDELCVNDLARAVGMKPQAVSNQLQRLADKRILENRRDGISILYRIVDPCVINLLDQGLCLLEDAKRRS